MYRTNDIKIGLLGLIGWRQNYDTQEFTIAESLTETETGQYFQDIHPLLTLSNIKAIAPDFARISYDPWESTKAYRKGERAASVGVNYRAKAYSLNANPETSPLEWEKFDAFSEWLEEKTQASISKAIQRFWSEKMAKKTAANIIESKALFDGAGRLNETIRKTNSVAGFEIVPIRAKGITLRIDKIGLQFKGIGQHVLYLMHSSQTEPIRRIELTRTKDGGMEWFTVKDLVLPYVSDDNDAGGSWYLVYDQSEMTEAMEAVNKSRDWSGEPCGTCSRSEYINWQLWSKYLEVHPFKVNDVERATEPDNIKMWDVSKQLYTHTTSYGINLQITLECDITDIILEQKTAFQNVIGLQVASDFIREFVYNPSFRIGRSQQNFNRMELLYELDGDSQSEKRSGVVWQLNKAMEALGLDTQKMSRICFPCNNGGIRYRTV